MSLVEYKEYDISNEVWDVYKKVYFDYISFPDNIKCKGKRRYCTYNRTKPISPASKDELYSFLLSGETDFNFHKNTKGQAQYNIYAKYLKESFQGDEWKRYQLILDRCRGYHHSIQNCSLMVCKGNLQGLKKAVGNDRLDTFVYLLNEYYENGVGIVLAKATYENSKSLIQYLNEFDNVYMYCRKIYFISEALTKKLIDHGKKAIVSGEDVVAYMQLANEFWLEKANYYQRVGIKVEVKDLFSLDIDTLDSLS